MAQAREEFGAAAAAVSYESSNARTKEAKIVLVLVAELPPSKEDTTVEKGAAEINRIEGMG